MNDFFSIFRLDLLQVVELVKPFLLPIIWYIIPPIAFLRNTPIVGLIASRIPVFILVCFFASSFVEVIIAIILFVFFENIADIVAYTKMYKFWLWFIKKIPENSQSDQLLQYYKKFPATITVLGTYSAFTSCLMAPFARKYDLHWTKFWIPRIITMTVVFCTYGVIYFYFKENFKFINNIISNVGWLVVGIFILGLLFNLVYSVKFLSDIKFIENVKKYIKKKKD